MVPVRVPSTVRGKVSLTRGSHCCIFFFISFTRSASLYCEEYVCVYIRISDSKGIVYELKVASETFLHTSGAVRSVDGIFIIGVPAWR